MKTPSEKKKALRKYFAANNPALTKDLNAVILPILQEFDYLLDRSQETLSKRLIKRLKVLSKKYKEEILKIEAKHRVILDPHSDDGIPANEFPTAVMSPVEVVSNQDEFLSIRIDLSVDKATLLENIDTAITYAQHKTENELTALQYRFFVEYFIRYYIEEKLSKPKALERISVDLETKIGIRLDADTLQRRYLKRFKTDHNVKDIRELRGGTNKLLNVTLIHRYLVVQGR